MTHEAVSVVIPVYQSAATLPDLVRRLHLVLGERGAAFEILLVNDGSRDQSWETVCELAERWPAVQGINLSRNYGQQNALLCGIRAARHPVIVTLDDDLQHPPEEIPLLLAQLTDDNDVVYGTPLHKQHGCWRDAASFTTKLVLRHLMGPAAQSVSAFRAFRTHLRDAFAHYCAPHVSIDVLLTWGTTRFTAVPVRHEPRRVGRSNYTFSKLCGHALTLLTGFSTAPLKAASVLGFLIVAFGVIILGWVLIRFLMEGSSVPGFPFLASIVAIFSGTQLFVQGIMGEYLARMHHRLMERPPYAIRGRRGEDGQEKRAA